MEAGGARGARRQAIALRGRRIGQPQQETGLKAADLGLESA